MHWLTYLLKKIVISCSNHLYLSSKKVCVHHNFMSWMHTCSHSQIYFVFVGERGEEYNWSVRVNRQKFSKTEWMSEMLSERDKIIGALVILVCLIKANAVNIVGSQAPIMYRIMYFLRKNRPQLKDAVHSHQYIQRGNFVHHMSRMRAHSHSQNLQGNKPEKSPTPKSAQFLCFHHRVDSGPGGLGQEMGNAQKCYILSSRSKSTHMYSLNGVFLKQVQQHPYAGVIISDDLKWGKHIAYISWKAGATVGFLRRNLRNCPKECRRLAYIVLVRSRLEYAETVGPILSTGYREAGKSAETGSPLHHKRLQD